MSLIICGGPQTEFFRMPGEPRAPGSSLDNLPIPDLSLGYWATVG
jgi:hypothetical protein